MIVALQKRGRLGIESLDYLKKIGFKVGKKKHDRHDYITLNGNTIILLRYGDIIRAVKNGIADCGVIGSDTFEENEGVFNDIQYKKLDFAHCKIVLASTKADNIKDVKHLEGKTIATEFPVLTQRHLSSNDVNSNIYRVKGSCEVYAHLNFASAIVDIVETGTSLKAYKMNIINHICDVQALLIYKDRKKVSKLLDKIEKYENEKG